MNLFRYTYFLHFTILNFINQKLEAEAEAEAEAKAEAEAPGSGTFWGSGSGSGKRKINGGRSGRQRARLWAHLGGREKMKSHCELCKFLTVYHYCTTN